MGRLLSLKNGDQITVSSATQEISVAVSEEEFEKRREGWTPRPLHKRGVLGKYAHNVTCSSSGAVTDYFNRN